MGPTDAAVVELAEGEEVVSVQPSSAGGRIACASSSSACICSAAPDGKVLARLSSIVAANVKGNRGKSTRKSARRLKSVKQNPSLRGISSIRIQLSIRKKALIRADTGEKGGEGMCGRVD